MTTEQPTILSLEAHGKKVTIQAPTSDIHIDEMIDMIKGVLYASGWGKETIDKYIEQYEQQGTNSG